MTKDEDWRVEVDVIEGGLARHLREALESRELTAEVAAQLGDGAVVSNDGDRLFIYTDALRAAQASEEVVKAIAREHHVELDTRITRWHESAEDWEPAEEGEPRSAADQESEHARLIERERREVADQGYPDWEVRVQYPSREGARELSARLAREGVPHLRRWRYVLVGATDEDAATALAERLRKEAGTSADVEIEGTFVSIARANPWRVWEESGGGP